MMSNLVFGGELVVTLDDIHPSVRPVVESTEALLERKRSRQGEIIVTLFEQCNLSCKFCNQDHESILGMDSITRKAPEIIKAIQLLHKMRKESFSVHLMGGELLQDSISEATLSDYIGLVREVVEFCRALDYPVEFVLVSNLIHFNTARVKALLDILRGENIDITLGTSYDPSMRFSPKDLMVFRKNLEIYHEYLSVVNVILTRPNINKFLTKNVPHFDYIYENFEVYFDYYTPEINHEIMAPSDREHRDMFVYLAHNYPRANPVAGWMETENTPLSCQSTYTIMPDNRAGRCTVLLNSFQKEIAPKTAGEMESEFMEKMDCLSCEFFSRCGLGCFLQQHFKGPNRTMNDCWMKHVHRAIEEVKNAR
jgi:hypothetical protein